MGNILQGSYIDVHEAARSGHIDEVRRWVDAGKQVDAQDNTRKTPLHHAAQWGQEETLDFLIGCGANVNSSDFIEDTPLHFACYWGHAGCAHMLIRAGADVNARDCYGNTPHQIFDDHVSERTLDEIRRMVRKAIRNPSREGGRSVDGHIKGMASAEESNDTGPSAGQRSSPSHQKDRLIAENAHAEHHDGGRPCEARPPPSQMSDPERDVDSQSDIRRQISNLNPQANSKGLTESGNLLTKKLGTSQRTKVTCESSSCGELPASPSMHDVPSRDTVERQDDEKQAKQEADIETAANDGRRFKNDKRELPVKSSVATGGISVPKNNITEDKTCSNNGTTMGSLGEVPSVTRGISERNLFPSFAEIFATYAVGPDGKLDVFRAARDGQVSVLRQALAEGAELNALDKCGLTALMWAARVGRLSSARYIIARGANVSLKHDSSGFTALHFAAYYCRSPVVKELVLSGANVHALDKRGTPPGARYQALSYLSYDGIRHRRLISRFLAGDLREDRVDKGKTMFPKHAPLEAYDEDHKPQYVRLGSSEHCIETSGFFEQDAENQEGAVAGASDLHEGCCDRGSPAAGESGKMKPFSPSESFQSTITNAHGDGIRTNNNQKASKLAGDQNHSPAAGSGVHYYRRRSTLSRKLQSAFSLRESLGPRQGSAADAASKAAAYVTSMLATADAAKASDKSALECAEAGRAGPGTEGEKFEDREIARHGAKCSRPNLSQGHASEGSTAARNKYIKQNTVESHEH